MDGKCWWYEIAMIAPLPAAKPCVHRVSKGKINGSVIGTMVIDDQLRVETRMQCG